MKLYIKYMVSIRCKLVVRAELVKMGFHHCIVDLGVVETSEPFSLQERSALKNALLQSGLELMEDKKAMLI